MRPDGDLAGIVLVFFFLFFFVCVSVCGVFSSSSFFFFQAKLVFVQKAEEFRGVGNRSKLRCVVC